MDITYIIGFGVMALIIWYCWKGTGKAKQIDKDPDEKSMKSFRNYRRYNKRD